MGQPGTNVDKVKLTTAVVDLLDSVYGVYGRFHGKGVEFEWICPYHKKLSDLIMWIPPHKRPGL